MVFKICEIGGLCAFCGESKYNPKTGEYDEVVRQFCGMAPPSWNVTVKSLPDCPKKMSKSALRKYQKDMIYLEKTR